MAFAVFAMGNHVGTLFETKRLSAAWRKI